jgi:hypothetical protein
MMRFRTMIFEAFVLFFTLFTLVTAFPLTSDTINLALPEPDRRNLLTSRNEAANLTARNGNCANDAVFGTCIDMCPDGDFGNCANNLCSDPCTCRTGAPSWNDGINSIRFTGNTKCYAMPEPGCQGNSLGIIYGSTGDVQGLFGGKVFSVQCWRPN